MTNIFSKGSELTTHNRILQYGFLTILLLASLPAYSVTVNVTSTDDVLADDGMCTLREAVIAANENFPSGFQPGECPAGLGADTIILTNAGIYRFSIPGSNEDIARTGDLDILEDVEIEGGDSDTFIIDAFSLDRIFDIEKDINVAIRNITITRGNAGSGGGVYSLGNITVEDSVIVNNTADSSGGGIYHSGGSLTLEDSVIISNTAAYLGGGIYHTAGSLTLNRIIFRHNQTTSTGQNRGGGGLYMDGRLLVNDSIFDNNSSAYYGGGIYFEGTESLITNTIFYGNTATYVGGAMLIRNTTISNSIFRENTAEQGGAIYVSYYSNNATVIENTFIGNMADTGGAIFTGNKLVVGNSTFSRNTASISGGGIHVLRYSTDVEHVTFDEGYDITSSAIFVTDGGTGTITNSLILGRCGGNSLVTLGGNIEAIGNTCDLTDPTDQSGVSITAVNLQPLKNNGGETQTQLPGVNSIALDGGVGSGCLLNDQRGVLRPQDFDGLNGAECDVGAVELLPCPHDANLTLDGTITWVTPTFEACERIEAGHGFEVADPDTIMHAGNAVVFTPGFSVLTGASLSVEVDWAFWENVP